MIQRALILIVCVMGLWSACPVAAQTPTSSPQPITPTRPATLTPTPFPIDVIYDTRVAFPHQVFFRIDIKLPATEVAGVTLVIDTINKLHTEINFPTDKPYSFAVGEVIATYIWEIPKDNPPPLFQPLRYTWRIKNTSGQQFEEVRSIEFTDERAVWQTTTALDNALTIIAPKDISRSIGSIQVELTDALTLLQEKVGQTPKVRLLIYDTGVTPGCGLDADKKPVYSAYKDDGSRAEQPCDLIQAETIYKASSDTVLQIGVDQNLTSALTASLVRDTYAPLWTGKPVPLWFSAGLEQFYQRQPNRDAFFTSREALRSDMPFTLAQMDTPPSAENAIVWNAQAYGMLIYLASRTGVENIFALARDIPQSASFEDAFKARMGFDIAGLVAAWQTWLFKRETENAYLYTPYLATTPTPTATVTQTQTPIPPTVTETFTATIELSATPRVTITRRPPPATVTPLPAQGLNIRPTLVPPTPIPNTPLAVLTRGSNPLIIGGGVLVALLMIGVLMLTSRRRG